MLVPMRMIRSIHTRRSVLLAAATAAGGAGACLLTGAGPESPASQASKPARAMALSANVRSYGAACNGRTDDTRAIETALRSGASRVVLDGPTLISRTLRVPRGVSLIGDGRAVVKCAFTRQQYIASIETAGALAGIEFVGADRRIQGDHIGIAQPYRYDDKVDGILLAGDSVHLERVKVTGARQGYVAASRKGLRLDNCATEATGYCAVNFYICGGITIAGGRYDYCGTFGGITLPSCYDFIVTGVWVRNPTSTGINPGGSATPNLNVYRGVVAGCTVEAGDGINFENGAEDCVVRDNMVLINSELGVSSGVGIGFFSHSGGSVLNNLIEGNEVRSATGGEAIKFGCDVGRQRCESVVVRRNVTAGSKVAVTIKSVAPVTGCIIAENDCRSDTYGLLQIAECTSLQVIGNAFVSSAQTTIGNYYGIYIQGPIHDTRYERNRTKGWGAHYRQEAKSVRSLIVAPRAEPNPRDRGAFALISAVNAAAMPVR